MTLTASGPRTSAVEPGLSAPLNARILLAFVLLAAFLPYVGTLRYDWVYDDGGQIVYNPLVQSWRFAPRYLVEHMWSNQINVPPNYYRPMFLLWCLLNYSAFGLNPMWWHLSTLVLHLLSTALLFYLARQLLRDDFSATIAALIFGVHPIHIESVAWISGVTDPLLAMFFFGGLLCYLSFRDGRRWGWLLASLALYFFAMGSKETGIVLPLVLLGYEWTVGEKERRRRRSVAVTAAYGAVAALYLGLRFRALSTFGNPVVGLPWQSFPLTWPLLLWFYVRKLFWPVSLSPFYDTPYVTRFDVQLFLLPALALLAAAAAGWMLWRRLKNCEAANPDTPSASQVALFALVLIAAPLLPVMDIVSLEPHEIAHDRYLYLPSAGFALLIAIAVQRIPAGERTLFGRPATQVAAALALALAGAIGVATQSVYWANDLLLFYRAVRVAPGSISATNNLANALLERKYYDEGIRLHQQILQRDPNYWLSWYNLGNAYTKLGRLEEAQEHIYRAAQLNNSNPNMFLYLGLLQMRMGHYRESEANIREALRIWPTGLGAHNVLGMVLEKQGRVAEAAEEYRRELALDPDQPKVREQLAAAEQRLKDAAR
ncbi:MAG TPA: tetratricopeptide repeat protein [Terriglobales bacterium]|nr:tetratricopeptide repeat protein [Terriglobales bacterium]